MIYFNMLEHFQWYIDLVKNYPNLVMCVGWLDLEVQVQFLRISL